MSEEAWYKMLAASLALHILVVASFSIPIKSSSRKIDLSSAYSVSLVGSPSAGTGGPAPKAVNEPAPKAEKPVPAVREKQPAPSKRPVPAKKEEDAVSLSRQKTPAPSKTTKAELERLEDRIRNIRKQADQVDVARAGPGTGTAGIGGGVPFSGDGTGRPLDPAMQRYLLDVWEKVKNAWNVPGMASHRKGLETIVVVKIRRDGRIVDINIEKRSGNRVYDESILRVLRAVEPLPPIPSSLKTDSVEIGFRFLPGELS